MPQAASILPVLMSSMTAAAAPAAATAGTGAALTGAAGATSAALPALAGGSAGTLGGSSLVSSLMPNAVASVVPAAAAPGTPEAAQIISTTFPRTVGAGFPTGAAPPPLPTNLPPSLGRAMGSGGWLSMPPADTIYPEGWGGPIQPAPPPSFGAQVGNAASSFGQGITSAPHTAPPANTSSPLAFKAANWLRGQGGPPLDMAKQMMWYRLLAGDQKHGGGAPTITPIPVPPPLPINFGGSMGGDPIQQLMLALQRR